MVQMRSLTIEAYHAGEWHEAALVTIRDADAGIAGATVVEYDQEYFFEVGDPARPEDGVRDARALSLRLPVDLNAHRFGGWPPFLLDLLPQGRMRRRLARERDVNEDSRALDLPLLERTGSSPIGNLRIKEA